MSQKSCFSRQQGHENNPGSHKTEAWAGFGDSVLDGPLWATSRDDPQSHRQHGGRYQSSAEATLATMGSGAVGEQGFADHE